VVEDGAQLLGEALQLVGGEPQAGQSGDVGDVVARDPLARAQNEVTLSAKSTARAAMSSLS
jgi:hypothetical protein